MASLKKSHVFRVTGLLRDQPDADLQNTLQKALTDNFTDDERLQIEAKIAIVPSCYETDTQRVALVQFSGGVPQFLNELRVDPLGDWQVEMGDCDINFDCHFFGFTQLYVPDDKGPVVADIIAIAGLDGHAYGSWQGRGNLGRMWLRDFLSKDLPQCRTMIYGYNSKLSSHGIDTILDYGRELMAEIKKIRNTKELQQRPIFFIAHSFGGIILAHCLVRAIQTMEEDHPAITSLYRATYGMILFAIPHKGLVVDDIQQMLAGGNNPRQHLLQQISSKPDVLIHQLADFKNLIRDRKVVSFYETQQTRKLVFDPENRRWKRAGDFITTVDADSALLGFSDYVEDKVPMHTDHSMIVKFDTRNTPGYRTALDKLREFAQDGPQVVAARFAQARHRRPPCSTVPFKRDLMFVGRENVLEEIKTRFQGVGQCHERLALVGLAGVGKTQTAIECSYRVRESAPATWVFWIHASNVARFHQAYRQIAAVAEIPGRDDPNANILQLVYWLCDERNGPWLTVLDNADDDRTFFSSDNSTEVPLVNLLPQVTHGSILITSRNRLPARHLVGDGQLIDIQPMNEDESLALLRAKNPTTQAATEDEKALAKVLEYLPLAITQAGFYIANRSPRVTVSRYLELFHESESNQAHLLQHEDAKDLRRDPDIRYAVITTWQLSFDQIRDERPAATDLLALMSMFDRQKIPEDLIHEDRDKLQFEDALAPLISYSLIQVEINESFFSMHRLVQLSVRTWLGIHLELAQWRQKSRKIMAHKFPDGEYESWPRCRVLLAHAKEVLKEMSKVDDDLVNMAIILIRCGACLNTQGPYREAEAMCRLALEVKEKVLGHKHSWIFETINYLGSILFKQRKYKEAEIMYQRALEGIEKVHGRGNPSMLRSIYNLGNVFVVQGEVDNAEKIFRRVLVCQEKILGRENHDTLLTVNNFGCVLSMQGKHEEAKVMILRALASRLKGFGPVHPDTLWSVNDLAYVLYTHGKFEEAEDMCRWALISRLKVLGPEHPDTLTSVNGLGYVLYRQGKHEEVETIHQWALRSKVEVTVIEDPDMDFTHRINFTYSPREMQETGNDVKILVYI